MQSFKQQLIITCKNLLDEKLKELQMALNEVTEAGNNETKSTAGDKHETARAMMQLEQEKLGKQVQEAVWQIEEFGKINFGNKSEKVALGSLLETDKGLFFVSVSIGKVEVEGKTVFVVSNKSPIGTALMGKGKGETLNFNNLNYVIKAVF